MDKKSLLGMGKTILLTTVGVLVAMQIQKQLDQRATTAPITED